MKEFVILFVSLVSCFLIVESCNESICASVVSKCLLTKSCNCDVQNGTCSALCFICLGKLSTECCSCVDLCPRDIAKVPEKQSTIEEHVEPIPELFRALVESDNNEMFWTSETYENYYTTSRGELVSTNCSVMWWAECTNFQKCKDQCISVGASSTRMFHNGCCECVGSTCINYGRSESACRLCSNNGTNDEYPAIPEANEELVEEDYGEEDNE